MRARVTWHWYGLEHSMRTSRAVTADKIQHGFGLFIQLTECKLAILLGLFSC